jgi:hypothetical protein
MHTNEMWFGPIKTNDGYFALGWDHWQSADIPMWVANGVEENHFGHVIVAAAEWVREGNDYSNKRIARIYFVDDSGRLDPEPVVEIRTPDANA